MWDISRDKLPAKAERLDFRGLYENLRDKTALSLFSSLDLIRKSGKIALEHLTPCTSHQLGAMFAIRESQFNSVLQ